MHRILMLAALALTGCGFHHSHGSSSGLGETQASPTFSTTLAPDRPISMPHQAVTLTLTVTNLTDQPQFIIDAWLTWRIADGGGTVVARSAPPDQEVGPTESFAAHEARTFTFAWDQSIGGGAYATGGDFAATAWLRTVPTSDLTGSCLITIIPPPPPPSDG
jgi:hypothetical protein